MQKRIKNITQPVASPMRLSAACISLCLMASLITLLMLTVSAAQAVEKARVAFIEFSGELRDEVSALSSEATREFTVIDTALVNAAVRGSGWSGSLNLTRDEARALALTIGCDFYLVGTARLFKRIVTDDKFYFEAIAGIFLVESRSGKLIHFGFIRTRADDEPTARRQFRHELQQRWKSISAVIAETVRKNVQISETIGTVTTDTLEIIDGDADTSGVSQPVFFQRLKPDYTEQAAALSIAATVDLQVVFQANGQAGEIEVMRWAGFGLDEAAIATVKQLRFKPAERHGKSLSFRALVRYNFRRPPDAAQKRDDAEQLRRSLRMPQFQGKPQDKLQN